MSDHPIDLRSDTFTVPDARMRALMAAAEVGDDVWGEDPTVRLLEERTAELLGKAAAVYVPSGTMANLLAVLAQTRPGDEVVADTQAHVVVYEAAGAAAVGGVQLRTLDDATGVPSADAVRQAIRVDDIHQPRSALLLVENTHNRRGGIAVAPARIAEAAAAAHDGDLRVHCDGARLFNAAVALGVDPAVLVRHCDSVSVCFSKGLGAPVGSALASDAATVAAARRWRKRLGGGMRQAGIIAAAALDALERNRGRLVEDHANAEILRRGLAASPGVSVVAGGVPTNIIMLTTQSPAAEVVAAAARVGVLLTAMDRNLVRCMTYLGISADDCRRSVELLSTLFSRRAA